MIEKSKIHLQMLEHWKQINTHTQQVTALEAILLQMTMLELADEHPEIVSFGYSGEINTDDATYFGWVASFYARIAGDLTNENDELVRSLQEYAFSQEAIQLAFEVEEWNGEISVEELRAAWQKGAEA